MALATANAHGTVAFNVDVNVAHGDVDVAFPVMYEGHSAGIRASCHNFSASYVDVNVAFFTPVPTPNAIKVPPSLLIAVHAVDAVDAGDIDVDVSDIEGEFTTFPPRIEKGNTV